MTAMLGAPASSGGSRSMETEVQVGNMARLEFDQYVDVAVRANIVATHRTGLLV
jgi:hypothetical protein